MADQTKTRHTSNTGTASLEFNDFDLNTTMQDFLKEEEKETGKSIWNIATISGMVMLFMAITFLIQWVGLPIGSGLAGFVSDAIVGLPIIGGALITLVGFGYFVGDRKRARKIKKARKKAKSGSSNYSDIPGAEQSSFSGNSKSRLSNALDSKGSASGSSTTSSFDNLDSYGYRHTRRLMKSRSDKKWAGVCGGLAKYFGISSTVVRFIFVAAFFMGYGASLLVYFGLSLAMPKEPVEMLDDFDY